jgi:pimeloyl-ACP methyl ester carboxylesterase
MLASTVERNSTKERSAASLKFSEVRLTNGIRLNYVEQGDENGVPVILLHGYTDSWFSYSLVLPLMDASYRVFALSQRGRNVSESLCS